jgi:hypothetical protein
MKALKMLPSGYEAHSTLDLSRQKTPALGFAIGSIGLCIVAGWLVVRLLPVFRSDVTELSFSIDGPMGNGVLLIGGFGLLATMVVLHEAIHGMFFWHFTGDRAVFGIRGLYAFAVAPSWHFPRRQYLIVALAPLVAITLVGTSLAALVPIPALIPLLVVIVANIGGSIGDLVVVAWLLRLAPGTLVRDSGDAVTIFVDTRQRQQPGEPHERVVQGRR